MAGRSAAIATGALLLLIGATNAEAQVTMPMRIPTTRNADPAPPKTGALRQLVCRGRQGLKVALLPDSGTSGDVPVSLAYRRNPRPAGAEYQQLEPGACTWNPYGEASLPPEPGVVNFYLPRKGSAWSADPTTFAIYLGDPEHYWSFYVDDYTNLSISHGSYRGRFWVAETKGDQPNRTSVASVRREELRCRGGAGLAFARGATAGDNLVTMTLTYKVASSAAGAVAQGLGPGTCAWVDRADARPEPGRVAFVTAANSQLKKVQSGTPVDRSATAAERHPDALTIPPYMADPNHYWSFTVSLANPDSATGHAAWKPALADGVSGSVRDASPTRSIPGSKVGGPRTPGQATSSTVAVAKAPLKLVRVNLVLDRFTIQFSARPNASPTVLYSTQDPVREPSTGRWFFPGGVVQGSGAVEGGFRAEVAGGTAQGFRADYSAWSRLPPARGTLYHYIITIPAGVDAKEEQLTGQLTTLAQHVRVVFTQIGVVSTRHNDLSFRFFAVPEGSQPVSRDIGPGLEWKEGYYPLEGQVIELPNAPDRLRVLVWGGDFGGALGKQLMPGYDWNLPPRNGSTSDENITRYELTIGGSSSERFVTFPFVMEPVYRAFFMFTVHGRVEVTRK